MRRSKINKEIKYFQDMYLRGTGCAYIGEIMAFRPSSVTVNSVKVKFIREALQKTFEEVKYFCFDKAFVDYTCFGYALLCKGFIESGDTTTHIPQGILSDHIDYITKNIFLRRQTQTKIHQLLNQLGFNTFEHSQYLNKKLSAVFTADAESYVYIFAGVLKNQQSAVIKIGRTKHLCGAKRMRQHVTKDFDVLVLLDVCREGGGVYSEPLFHAMMYRDYPWLVEGSMYRPNGSRITELYRFGCLSNIWDCWSRYLES